MNGDVKSSTNGANCRMSDDENRSTNGLMSLMSGGENRSKNDGGNLHLTNDDGDDGGDAKKCFRFHLLLNQTDFPFLLPRLFPRRKT